jgi:hypothetical protein
MTEPLIPAPPPPPAESRVILVGLDITFGDMFAIVFKVFIASAVLGALAWMLIFWFRLTL